MTLDNFGSPPKWWCDFEKKRFYGDLGIKKELKLEFFGSSENSLKVA